MSVSLSVAALPLASTPVLGTRGGEGWRRGIVGVSWQERRMFEGYDIKDFNCVFREFLNSIVRSG